MRSDHNSREQPRSASFESLVADVFRRNGWKVIRRPKLKNRHGDLLVRRGDALYLAAVKAAAEGRRDRIIPMLSQAILQAQAAAAQSEERATPLAVVGANRIAGQVWEASRRFAAEFAPKVAIGLIDLEGFRAFAGRGLESLNALSTERPRQIPAAHAPSAQLFSDLNQWMLKVLLAPRTPDSLLSAPRHEYRNASELAKAARVSVMSAFRFVSQLIKEGFLADASQVLRLVRIEELLKRWQAANQLHARETAMRFVIRGDEVEQIHRMLRAYQAQCRSAVRVRSRHRPPPRVALGLFAAADALDIGFVHGAPLHLYLERIDEELLGRLGLLPHRGESAVDLYVRIPAARESVFRGSVERDGVPVADVLQIWLDVSSHPARGSKQAEEIRRRFLVPLFQQEG